MARYIFVLLLALFLAAYGGADDQDLTKRYALQARAQAWENRMPMAIIPGQELGCTGLMVSFSFYSQQYFNPASTGFGSGCDAIKTRAATIGN